MTKECFHHQSCQASINNMSNQNVVTCPNHVIRNKVEWRTDKTILNIHKILSSSTILIEMMPKTHLHKKSFIVDTKLENSNDEHFQLENFNYSDKGMNNSNFSSERQQFDHMEDCRWKENEYTVTHSSREERQYGIHANPSRGIDSRDTIIIITTKTNECPRKPIFVIINQIICTAIIIIQFFLIDQQMYKVISREMGGKSQFASIWIFFF